MIIRKNLVDIHSRSIYPAEIVVEKGRIKSISKVDAVFDQFIMPGFVDAHVHIESSMVTPVEFSRCAVSHGTVGVVSDPHEIANVLGMSGVDFMLTNAEQTPLKILFGAPSCVPATPFESSGAVIDTGMIGELLERKGVGFLSEMMNYPGVLNDDLMVKGKLEMAKKKGVPIDGHAPGLMGQGLKKYAEAGISTDHECFTLEEGLEKIDAGMKILIREGSGAKNYQALSPLLKSNPDDLMFCTDDLHPDDLLKGHINKLVSHAIKEGYDLFDVLRAASYNAVCHYNLDVGLLREGDSADFIIVDKPEVGKIISTYINGEPVYSDGKANIGQVNSDRPNQFNTETISPTDISVRENGKRIRIIEAIDGELITKEKVIDANIIKGRVETDPSKDILKIVVVNRYENKKPAVAFIRGFGLKRGAIVSSIGHDSHNIICVGVTDREISEAINWVIEQKGGIALHDGDQVNGLPLEIGGIISVGTVEQAARAYNELSQEAQKSGSGMKAPFMTLSFMSLLVIPDIKLSDKGLFDGKKFVFTSLFENDV